MWYLATRNGTPEQVEKFRARLWMPTKGTAPDPRSPWSPANETAAFSALRSSLGVGGVRSATQGR